jgi:hypothetical protein
VFAYCCRRCPRCKMGFILQLLLDPGSGLPVFPFNVSADNCCPLCHGTFQPENYFVVRTSSPLGESLGTDT